MGRIYSFQPNFDKNLIAIAVRKFVHLEQDLPRKTALQMKKSPVWRASNHSKYQKSILNNKSTYLKFHIKWNLNIKNIWKNVKFLYATSAETAWKKLRN